MSETNVYDILAKFINWLEKEIDCKLEKILMNQDELQAALEAQNATVAAITEQLNKVSSEVQAASAAQVAAIEALKAELANVQLSDTAVAAVNNLDASIQQAASIAQALDDLNPDAPVA